MTDEDIERAIDWMENNDMPLLPWQATAFRAIMRGDGKGTVVITNMARQHPQRLGYDYEGH